MTAQRQYFQGLLTGALIFLLAACGSTPRPVVATPPVPSVAQAPAAAVEPVRPLVPPANLVKPVKVDDDSVSLWADEYLFAGWRIQRHFYEGTSRLVDARGFLRARGSYVACKAAFDYLRKVEHVQPKSRHLVLLLHGLGSKPSTMQTLRVAIERDGFEAETVTYPTTEQGVVPNADGVEKLLLNLEGYEDVAIVSHSLGGLITRAALSRLSFAYLPVPVKTVVMLGTPNQGAVLASALRPLARAAVTASANDLLPERARQLGDIPASVRLGVIAGGRGSRFGYNPLLAGDNDSIVRVEETKTGNMKEWITLPVLHTSMTTDAACISAVRRFLLGGTLKAPAAPTRPLG